MRPRPALRILSVHKPGQQNPEREATEQRNKQREKMERDGGEDRGGRPAGPRDSPVGVRGLVNDVLVGGQQGQSVLTEIHSHVSVPASIQTAADGERDTHGMRL